MEILRNITFRELIQCFALGGIAIGVFQFCGDRPPIKHYTLSAFVAFVFGYVWSNIFGIFPSTGFLHLDAVLMCIVVVLVSYAFSRATNNPIFDRLLSHFGILHTVNQNVWKDIIDAERGSTVFVGLQEQDVFYVGVLKLVESNQRKPFIVLTKFKRTTWDDRFKYQGEDAFTFEHMEERCVVIDMAYVTHFEIHYSKDSPKVKSTDFGNLWFNKKKNLKTPAPSHRGRFIVQIGDNNLGKLNKTPSDGNS